MRLVSWNVNGIRAAWSHGLSAFLDDYDADIYCFQETKTTEPITEIQLPGYEPFWSFCTHRRGYSGTLCLSRYKPLDVSYDIGGDIFDIDTEGRIITLDFPDFYLVNCYVPNSQFSEQRSDYREKWDILLLVYLQQLKAKKCVIVCGDFNVPVSDQDVYAENQRAERNAPFLSVERENLLLLLENGFVDTYRLRHSDETGKYTWWSKRLAKRSENRGWRLDYFLVSQELTDFVEESTMLSDVMGSDHCPILLKIDLPPQGSEVTPLEHDYRMVYTYKDLIKMQESNQSLDFLIRRDLSAIWNSIDWESVERRMESMQMALAKSAHTRDPELITKWQNRIIHSLDAKVLAVRHVCNSNGGPGVDNIMWHTAHEKMSAALALTSRGYQAMPSRLLVVSSGNGRQRRIHVETCHDKAMQTLYAFALDPIAESWGERKSFAYRKGRSAYDLNEYVRSGLSGPNAPEWLFVCDVKKCYERMSHSWILEHIPLSRHILTEFLKAGYVFGGELFPTNIGVGIGCSISPIIANMVLDGLQEYIFDQLYPLGTERDYANGNLVRYADDIIVMTRNKMTAMRVRQIVADFLEERGLELSTEKTHIVHISDGFDYMSRSYYKRGDQVYSKPSQKAIERFMENIRDTIQKHKGSQKSLIETINRKIDGFVTYHKVGEAEDAFRYLDVYIQALLLELCKKKHPGWPQGKILGRYWYVGADGRHCYTLPDKREVRVKFLADTLCKDYVPVKTNVNPYIDIEYLEQRTNSRKMMNVAGVYAAIWKRQEGKCYYCGKKILRDEEKALVEVDSEQSRFAARNAYVHKRCLDSSIEYIDSSTLPASVDDVMNLLKQLESEQRLNAQKYLVLSEFFRTCDKKSITLTFREIENLLGEELGPTARRSEFWYRTGFNCISQCWLENGYEIKTLHLEDRPRVGFRLALDNRNTSGVNIPSVLKHGRIPKEAKYELENYFQYIIKKYAL